MKRNPSTAAGWDLTLFSPLLIFQDNKIAEYFSLQAPSSSVSVNGPPTELICLDPAWKGFLERIGIIVSASIFMELPPTYSLAAFAAARLINFAPDASQP